MRVKYMKDKKRIVITGMGAVTPIGIGVENFWTSLVNGVSGIKEIDIFDTTDYTSKIAGLVKDFEAEKFIDAKKIKKMEKFTQFAVASAKMAMEDSKLELEKEDKTRIGVILGCGIGGLNTIEQQTKILLEKGPRRVSPFLIPMLITNIAPGEVAIEFGLKGINFSVSTACASATHAIGEAVRALRYGDADVILTGGTEGAVTPLGLAGFCSLKAVSTRNDDPKSASRPFDKDRDGFVMGEGAGVIVLETLEHAKARGARIYAELSGYGATDDAYHITSPDLEGTASTNCVRNAIKDSGFNLEDIDYINPHGTSTSLNDKIETLVFKKVFGERAYKIPISSTKSMTGHLLGAAGAVELIACVKTIETGIIHPTINYTTPDEDCDLDYVPNVCRKNQNVKVAISNSLGFGGHNSTIVVNKYE
jgi:3-oxoacyl-[acyl-carrier-protein] synthase II